MPISKLAFTEYDIDLFDNVKGQVLDDLLAEGWYRMGALMHSCETLKVDNTVSNVFWLRYNVNAIILGKSSRRIIRLNKNFSYEIKPYKITKQLNNLFHLYFLNVNFDMFNSLEAATNDPERKIFDTYVIQIKDGNKLIAAGIFDIGENSIAAIRNIYDPLYSKYSLGKYLMILAYQFCVKNTIKWFYPGYIIKGYPKFDYKLFLDKKATEIYIYDLKQWKPYSEVLE
jgi:arginine-tRNA-protein transferase